MYFLVARPGISGASRPPIAPDTPAPKILDQISSFRFMQQARRALARLWNSSRNRFTIGLARSNILLSRWSRADQRRGLSLGFIKCLSRQPSVSTLIISSLVNYGTCDSTPVICAELSLRYRVRVEPLGIKADPGFYKSLLDFVSWRRLARLPRGSIACHARSLSHHVSQLQLIFREGVEVLLVSGIRRHDVSP